MASAGDTAARSGEPGWLVRFDGVERAVHWLTAVLFAVLIFTGAALYFPPLIAVIGRRELVERVHLYCGLALPLPLVLALCGGWGRALRRDLARFNRWSDDERSRLRTFLAGHRGQPAPGEAGKFNPGQKLNAAFTAGGALVMLATGCILRWYRPFPLAWRAGATFVHNWVALVFLVVISGHLAMALTHPEPLRAIVTGRITRRWARLHAPAWLREQAGSTGSEAETAGPGAAPRR